jgi:hypothetical protein
MIRQPGPPMTLGNMREQGVRSLAVYCLNHACLHQTVINVDDCPAEIEVPSFGRCMKCSKCGGRRVDVRPNRKERSGMPDRAGEAVPTRRQQDRAVEESSTALT